MGGHNRPTLSQRWVGVDGEQVFARDARDWRKRRDLKFEVQGSKFRKPRTSDRAPRTIVFLAHPIRLARLSCGP